MIDLQPLFFCLTLDVSSAFLFGESVKSLMASESATAQNLGDAFNAAQAIAATRFRLPGLYWMIGESEFCKDIHHFADEIIDRNLSSQRSEKKSVFLDQVAESTADRAALRGQIVKSPDSRSRYNSLFTNTGFLPACSSPKRAREASRRNRNLSSRPSQSHKDRFSKDDLPSECPQRNSAVVSIGPCE